MGITMWAFIGFVVFRVSGGLLVTSKDKGYDGLATFFTLLSCAGFVVMVVNLCRLILHYAP